MPCCAAQLSFSGILKNSILKKNTAGDVLYTVADAHCSLNEPEECIRTFEKMIEKFDGLEPYCEKAKHRCWRFPFRTNSMIGWNLSSTVF